MSRTPLNSLEDGGFQRLRETGVESASLLTFTVECLEVIKAALASYLALELLQAVEGHPGCIVSENWSVIDDEGAAQRVVRTRMSRIFRQ